MLTGIFRFRNLLTTTYLPDVGGRGEIKIALASTRSANEPAKDLILVYTVQLKPMIKAQISRRMISSGISDVAIASIYIEKTRLKKLIMILLLIQVPEKIFTSI